ncbi:hypothetical protein V8C86DRAFT_1488383 [Haematococcus lacustris]
MWCLLAYALLPKYSTWCNARPQGPSDLTLRQCGGNRFAIRIGHDSGPLARTPQPARTRTCTCTRIQPKQDGLVTLTLTNMIRDFKQQSNPSRTTLAPTTGVVDCLCEVFNVLTLVTGLQAKICITSMIRHQGSHTLS